VFQIEDDGPAVVVTGATPDTLVLDETRPVGTEEDGDSDPAGLATVTASFADNFDSGSSDFGSDGAGSESYALALTGGPNVASGLFALDATDTEDVIDGIGQGDEIVLNLSGDTITGSAGGTDYFTIEIDTTTGEVTFTQLANIWHSDPNDDDDTETLTAAAGAVKITKTVTDADGDSETAEIDLSTGVFQIEDDGPILTGTATALAVDEDDLLSPPASFAGNSDVVAGDDLADPSPTSVSGSLAVDFGTDGVGGVTSIAYTGAALTSLTDTVDFSFDDATDTLTAYVESGDAGGLDILDRQVFTVAVDEVANEYTFTLLDNLDHTSTTEEENLLLTFNAVVTDGDGDAVTQALSVDVDDDLPTTPTPPQVAPDVLDDEGLTGGIAGGPGDTEFELTSTAGILGYSLGAGGVDSIVLSGPSTLGTEAVGSVWNAGTNTLTISSARGDLMTVQVTNLVTGAYTVTLLKPLMHPFTDADGLNNGPETEYEDDITLTVNYTITNTGGASADGSLLVTIDDDSPVLSGIQDAIVANTDGTVIGNIDVSFGADGFAGAGLTIVDFDDLDGIIEVLSGDGKTLTAYIDADGDGIVDAGEEQFYELALDDATKTYTFEHSARPVVEFDLDFSQATGGPGSEFLDVPAGTDLMVKFNGGILVAGVLTDLGEPPPNSANNDDVKPTGTGFGIGDSSGQTTMEDGEGFFVTVSENGGPFTHEIDSFSFAVQRNGGNANSNITVNWQAYDEFDVAIVGGAGSTNIPIPQNNTNVPVSINPPGEFAKLAVWFTNVNGGDGNIRIEQFSIGTVVIPEDQPLQFDIIATDGDGDATQEETLDILLQGGAGPDFTLTAAVATENEILQGGPGNDTLTGDGENNTLIGEAGQDTMTGAGGADTFSFGSTGDSTTSTGTADLINGFDDDVDKIDLSSIDANATLADDQEFGWGGMNAGYLDGQVTWNEEGGTTTVVRVDVLNSADQMLVVLDGINLSLSDTDFIL
jgi:hypothetical protein